MRHLIRHITKKRLLVSVVLLLTASSIFLTLLLFSPYLEMKTEQRAPDSAFPELLILKGKKDSTFQQTTNFFQHIAENKGADYAYEVLLRAELPPNTDLHLLAHAVGDILYEQLGIKGIHTCTDDFRNACSHSIVIAHLLKYGPESLQEINQACRKAPGGKGAYTMCFHGLGHGVLAFSGYDMQKAVELCKTTGSVAYGSREYPECVGGMMMEMISGVHDTKVWQTQKDQYFSSLDPLAPCNMDFIEDMVRPNCYQYLTPHLFELAGADLQNPSEQHYRKAFTYCNEIPDEKPADREACYGGLGKEFVVLAQQKDIRKIETISDIQLQKIAGWCGLAPNDFARNSCNTNVINSLFWGGENDSSISVKYCDTLDKKNQEGCFDHLTSLVKFYIDSSSQRQSFCNTLKDTRRTSCMQVFALEKH